VVATASTMLALGTPAPPFSLPDPSGRIVSLTDFTDARALLVMFLSNHCPYVKLVREELARLGADYERRGVAAVAIMSNDVREYPEDAPERMAEVAREVGFTFPYLHDDTQDVAKAYRAACTPDFFLFDARRRLVYRGELDDARPGNGVPVTGNDLRAALEAVLGGRPVPEPQLPSLGCNIKWRAGSEPEYFTLTHA